MHHALPSSQPLDIAATESRGGTERVGMIDVAASHDRDGLESAMGMGWEPRHRLAVIHAPTVFAGKVLAESPSPERCVRSQRRIALRVGILVIYAEEEWIQCCPGKAELADLDLAFTCHDGTPLDY